MNEKLIKLNYSQYSSSFIKHIECTAPLEEYFSLDTLTSALLDFITKIKKAGQSINTISTYRNNILIFIEFLMENKMNSRNYTISREDLWLNFLKENGRGSNESVRRIQLSLHYFFNFLTTGKIMTDLYFPKVKNPIFKQKIQWDLSKIILKEN